jgi:hypothetical protein
MWPQAWFQEKETKVSVLKTPRYLEVTGREANAKFLIDVLPTMKLNQALTVVLLLIRFSLYVLMLKTKELVREKRLDLYRGYTRIEFVQDYNSLPGVFFVVLLHFCRRYPGSCFQILACSLFIILFSFLYNLCG